MAIVTLARAFLRGLASRISRRQWLDAAEDAAESVLSLSVGLLFWAAAAPLLAAYGWAARELWTAPGYAPGLVVVGAGIVIACALAQWLIEELRAMVLPPVIITLDARIDPPEISDPLDYGR